MLRLMQVLISILSAAALVLLVLLALAAGWLVATWFFADDEKALGPAGPKRVTFKHVVQNALRDVREICKPFFGWLRRIWLFWGPRVTNTVALAVYGLDAVIGSTPQLKALLMANPWGFAAICAINALVTLSPRHAPDRIPPPSAV